MGTESVSSQGDVGPPRDVIRLVRFFIFNSAFGPKEGEEAKRIIFYHAENEAEHKTRQVGLAEAVVRFSSVFSDMPCESLHTQKSKSVFYEPEPGYVLVLAVSVPCVPRRKLNSSATEHVYHPENVHDNLLLTILKRGYEMFRFFTGGFDHLKPDDGRELFIHRVTAFFTRYVSGLHFDKPDVSDLFQAVHFLTLEASAFLQVQSFVHRVEDEFGCIDTCAFFHQGFVAWSGLQQKETALLYHYIYTNLLPTTLSRTSAYQPTLGPFNGHQGRFLTGPQSLKDSDVSLTVPKVFVPNPERGGLREHHLVVYHALGATLCLLVPCEIELTLDFFRRLDGHLGPRLTHMSADLHNVFGRHFGPSPGMLGDQASSASLSTSPGPTSSMGPPVSSGCDSDDRFHFMYYNSYNNAMKSTLPQVVTRSPTDENLAIKDAVHVISDLEMDFTRIKKRSYTGANLLESSSSSAADISVKLPNDQWVVGKMDGQRQVYTVVQSKSANLIDVGEEVDRMMSHEFKNICLLDKIQKTLAVPGTFDPRNRATSRTYVYKFAVRKNPEEIPASLVDLIHIWKPGELKSNRKNVSKMQRAASILPLGDIGKITEVLDKFDFDKACEVTNMFLGENNLGSFASTTCWSPKIRLKDGFKTRVHFPLEFFNRNITECSLMLVPPPACMMSEPIYECFDFYTLTVTSRSFFRNQIRRMAAIILNVARGEKDISEVRYLLDNPSSDNCTGLPLAKPDGLYLAKLEYSPDDPDLMVATDSIDKLPVGPEPNPDIIRNPMIDWSHKNHILDVTEPLLGYRWFDPKVYLKKETKEKEKSADDEVDSN